MNKTNTTAVRNAACSMIETLEGRQLRSATPAVVAYLPAWASDSAVVANLKATKFSGITQLNYFSVVPTTDGLLPGTTVNEQTNDSTKTTSDTELSDLNTLVPAAHDAGVKVNIVIGGAGKDSNELHEVVNGGQDAWDTFAASIGQFAAKYGIDGVDLDWEPAKLAKNERTRYGQLIQTIDNANPGLHLSAAVNAEKLNDATVGDKQYVLDGNAVQHLDEVMVMAYDLEADNVSRTSVAEADMTAWGTYVGNSKSKLVFGLPFYGTQGTDWDHDVDSDGYASLIARNGSLPAVDADSMQVDGKDWSYNGPTTIYNKTDFAIDNGYAGVGVWAITHDYLNGQGQYDSTHSLLPQIIRAITDNAGNPTTPTTPTTPTEPTIPNAQLAAVVTSSSPSYRNWQAGKAVDGDLTTYFQGNTAGTANNPEWVTLDFGSAKVLSKIQYAARQDARWTMAGGVFQASNTADFSNAVDLFSVNSTPAAGLQSHTVSGTYRYVRYLAPIGSYGNIAEFQAFGHTPYATSNVRTANASVFSQSNQVISLIDSQN